MLNLLANSAENSSEAITALITALGPFVGIFIVFGVLAILRDIFNFFVPFHIHSMKKSQKKLVKLEEEQLDLERKRLEIDRYILKRLINQNTDKEN